MDGVALNRPDRGTGVSSAMFTVPNDLSEVNEVDLSNVSQFASFGVCLPLMVAGLVLSLREWRRWLLLYLFVAAYAAIHLISWTQIRYRMPIDAALVPFAGLAVVGLVSYVVRRWRTMDDGR